MLSISIMDFKLLKEIKQVSMIETLISHFQNGCQIGTWKSMCKPNKRRPDALLSFHFQASSLASSPNRSDTWEAIKAVTKTMYCSICRKLVNTPLKLNSHSFSRMPSVPHRIKVRKELSCISSLFWLVVTKTLYYFSRVIDRPFMLTMISSHLNRITQSPSTTLIVSGLSGVKTTSVKLKTTKKTDPATRVAMNE